QRPLSIDAGKRACSSACAAPFGCARKSSPNQDGGYRAQMWVSLALLETFHTCAGAVLILLGRATTNRAGAYPHTTADHPHRTARKTCTAPWPRNMWLSSAMTIPRNVGWSARGVRSPLGRPNAAEATALPWLP